MVDRGEQVVDNVCNIGCFRKIFWMWYNIFVKLLDCSTALPISAKNVERKNNAISFLSIYIEKLLCLGYKKVNSRKTTRQNEFIRKSYLNQMFQTLMLFATLKTNLVK